MATATYLIPECNLAELEARIDKLNKRAKRLGVPAITLTKKVDHLRHQVRQLTVNLTTNLTWRESIEKVPNPSNAFLANSFEPTGLVMAWWTVEVTGETPTLNGWTFTAVLEPLTTEDGETINFVRVLPGETCPAEYRDAIGRCDHCHTARRRNETFVVRHESGEYKVVGRQCLKDFLAYHADPHALASWAETLAQLGDLCNEAGDEDWLGNGGGSRESGWDLKRFLTTTATRIRLFGWLGRGKARDEGYQRTATADNVIFILTPPSTRASEREREEYNKFCDQHPEAAEDAVTAESAIEWAKDLAASEIEGNDYLANVNLVARVGMASRKTAGVAASILIAYAKAVEREINRQKREAKPESKWIGEVGKRLKMIEVTVEKVIGHDGMYGSVGIHKMVTKDGSDLTWFCSGGEWLKEGMTYTVDATVKKHEEFRGRKQTVLTRVTVLSEEWLAEYRAKAAKKAERLAKKAAREAKKNNGTALTAGV